MAQVTIAQVVDLTEAVLDHARTLYRIQAIDRKARVHLSPMEMSANLGREVSVKEVAEANKQIKLDLAATKDEFSALARQQREAWMALVPENATPGSRKRIDAIIYRIVRNRRAVTAEYLQRDIRSVCNMNY